MREITLADAARNVSGASATGSSARNHVVEGLVGSFRNASEAQMAHRMAIELASEAPVTTPKPHRGRAGVPTDAPPSISMSRQTG